MVKASHEMCVYCFDSVKSYLNDEIMKSKPNFPNEKCPLFVTWMKKDSKNNYNLRGCIGTFRKIPLHLGLKKYSIYSATEDDRFSKMSLSEFPDLRCEISILRKFENVDDVFDWNIGQHGIQISFDHPHTEENCSATFLPHVAKEWDWNKITTLQHLFRKAGYSGKLSKSLLQSTTLVRYQCSKIKLSYNQYLKYKQNEDEGDNNKQ